MKDTKKPCYFKEFLKSINLVVALLFTAIVSTVFVLGFSSGLWNAVLKNTPYLIYSLSVIGVFFILSLIYVVCSAKKSNVKVSDAIPFAMILSAIVCAVYILLESEFTLLRIVYLASLFVIGILLLILNVLSFNPDVQEQNVIYTKNNVSAYYKTLGKKYSLFTILCIASVCTCFTTLLFHPQFGFALNREQFLVLAVFGLPTVLYLAYVAGSKNICEADALLHALFITMPLALVQILVFKDYSLERNLAVWGVAFALIILYTFMRYRTFDFVERDDDKLIEKTSPAGYFFKTITKNYNFLLVLAVASVLAISAFIVFPLEQISNSVVIEGKKFAMDSNFMLIGIIDFAVISTVIVCAVFSFLNMPISKVNYADFLLLILIAFAIFGLVTLVVAFSIIKLVLLFAILVYGLSLFFARARAVYFAE